MDESADTPRRLIDTAMRLAAERGWRQTTLFAVAAEAGVPLVEVYRHFPTRADILTALVRQADDGVLAEYGAESAVPDPEETVRDRLFDVLMRRFDALDPYRRGIAAVLRAMRTDPLEAMALGPAFARSMAWMLRAAGVEPAGGRGVFQVGGLGAIYLAVLKVWLADDTPDKARTMADLDARLRCVERMAGAIRRPPREDASAEAAAG